MPYQKSPGTQQQVYKGDDRPLPTQKVQAFQPEEDDFYEDDFDANERDDFGTVKTLATTAAVTQVNKFASPARGAQSADAGFYKPDS